MDIKFLRSTILFNDLFEVSPIHLKQASPIFADLFNLIEQALENSKDSFQPDILKNHLHNLLLLAERKQGFTEIKKTADLDYTILFKSLLDNKYKQIKQVSIYAGQINVTEKRLNQATSKVLDKSPKQMIDERIMLEAKRLLLTPMKPLRKLVLN